MIKNLFHKNILPIFGTLTFIATCPALAADPMVLTNKSSSFDSVLSDMNEGANKRSQNELAAKIREQRAKLDSKDEKTMAKTSATKNVNKCDTELRACMKEKCGNDFSQCYTDNETIWGDKLDACRRNTECTGHEYAVLAPEIAADRDMNVRMSVYQEIIDCGNEYNSCIFANCGTTLDKCVAKSDGDAVIEKCKDIADKCKEQDNGMAGRAMEVFANLRQQAIVQAREDEARLYKLRETMEAECKRNGAMFDQRSLVCVYTVNFYAGDQPDHPMASKKLYGGGTFQCTPEWFGIDLTTFKENAYRLTRSEKGASSAALGAGLGTAVSTFTGGYIQNAIQEKGVSWKPGEEGKSLEEIKENRETKQAERQQKRENNKEAREKKRDDNKKAREAKRSEKNKPGATESNKGDDGTKDGEGSKGNDGGEAGAAAAGAAGAAAGAGGLTKMETKTDMTIKQEEYVPEALKAKPAETKDNNDATTKDSNKNTTNKNKNETNKTETDNKSQQKNKKGNKQQEPLSAEAKRQNCKDSGGHPTIGGGCTCPEGQEADLSTNKCEVDKLRAIIKEEKEEKKKLCSNGGGSWASNRCECSNGMIFDSKTGGCKKPTDKDKKNCEKQGTGAYFEKGYCKVPSKAELDAAAKSAMKNVIPGLIK